MDGGRVTMANRRDIESIERTLRELEDDAPRDGDLEIVIRNSLVMTRERAEREGREILGPSEEAVGPGYVKVPAGEETIQL